MIDAHDLAEAFAHNLAIAKMQSAGLTQEDSLRQQPVQGNCLNWVLGHIAIHRDKVLALLGEPPLMGEAGARYQRESEPLTAADSGVLPLEELLDWIARAQERITVALSTTDEAAFAREASGNGRKRTVGQAIFFLYFHECYHIGQTELFRQLAGKTDKLI
ncbi:MAG TPA: DinB family protein [Ktedonobacterales bacterium]|nr:DinB family protein [Ktedonobacterales bacterium]